MWTCECGEFNNDSAAFCVNCKKVRIPEKEMRDLVKASHTTTESMFRKMQEFVLLDIALLCIIAIVGFIVARYGESSDDKIIAYLSLFVVLVLFQLFLFIGMLRLFYNAAINAERTTFFLQKIYEMIKADEEKEREEEVGHKPPI